MIVGNPNESSNVIHVDFGLNRVDVLSKKLHHIETAKKGRNTNLQKEYKVYALRITKPAGRQLKMKNDMWFVGPKLRLHRTAGSIRRAQEAEKAYKRKFRGALKLSA